MYTGETAGLQLQAVMVFDSWGGVLADGAFQRFSLAYTRRVVQQLQRERDGARVPVIVFTKGGGAWLEEIADCGADVCNAVTCQTGTCVPGIPPCDDGNPCTDDRCDALSGRCTNTPIPCTNGATCTRGHCVPRQGSAHECVYDPLTASSFDSVSCAVDEDLTPDCPSGRIPALISQRLTAARKLISNAANGKRTAELLMRARKRVSALARRLAMHKRPEPGSWRDCKPRLTAMVEDMEKRINDWLHANGFMNAPK